MTFYMTSNSCQIAGLSDILEQYFGQKTDGTFVEVGAHDGYSFSNTWGLALSGWKGVMYEPMEHLYELCKAIHAHRDITVIQACVSDTVGEVTLYTDGCPTIDVETMERSPWGFEYDPQNFIKSPCTTLNVSLAELDWPKEFDLLGIDVEGAEMQVLRGIDLSVWKPRMIIVETHEGHDDARRTFHVDAINEFFAMQPYTKVHVDGLNTIYWRNDETNI